MKDVLGFAVLAILALALNLALLAAGVWVVVEVLKATGVVA